MYLFSKTMLPSPLPHDVSKARSDSPRKRPSTRGLLKAPIMTPSNDPLPPNATGVVGVPKSVMMPASS
jgi:hypothetical protein